MFRSLVSCLLLLAVAATTSAQTQPATIRHTTATPKKTTVRHPAGKAHITGRKASTSKGAATARRPAGATATGTSRMANATGSTATAEGKGQGVYAAPGEPVNLQTTPTQGYDGPAAKRKKSATTLTPR